MCLLSQASMRPCLYGSQSRKTCLKVESCEVLGEVGRKVSQFKELNKETRMIPSKGFTPRLRKKSFHPIHTIFTLSQYHFYGFYEVGYLPIHISKTYLCVAFVVSFHLDHYFIEDISFILSQFWRLLPCGFMVVVGRTSMIRSRIACCFHNWYRRSFPPSNLQSASIRCDPFYILRYMVIWLLCVKWPQWSQELGDVTPQQALRTNRFPSSPRLFEPGSAEELVSLRKRSSS